jgi:methyl-accepting chemotaxis protein
MLKNLKLSTKLIGSFFIMAAIVAVTGTFGIVSINRVGTEVKTIMVHRAAEEKLVFLMEVTQKACRVNLVEAALVRTEKAEFEKYVETYNKKRELFRNYVNIFFQGDRKLGINAAPKGSMIEEQAKSLLSSWAAFEEVAAKFIAHKSALLKGVTPGTVDQVAKNALADDRLNELTRKEIMEASENAKLDIDDLADTVETQMVLAEKETGRIKKTATMAFISVILFAVVLAIVLGGLITKTIMRRIEMMVEALKRGADGDLTVRLETDSHDELGKLGGDFNAMSEKLEEMVGKVSHSLGDLARISANITAASRQVVSAAELQSGGVEQTSSAVLEIGASVKEVGENVDNLASSASESSSSMLEMAASIDEVASNVEILAMSVEEVSSSIVEMAASIKQIGASVAHLLDAAATTASSVEQMDTSIQQVEKNAMETAAISEEVVKDAQSGRIAVEATIVGIKEIRRSSKITGDVIVTLSTRADNIGAILAVIDEVAEQTNLLALNAAIIAAQAGERGKGFAVVADEIKELAERTRSSTREITQVIQGVQEETRRAVTAISQAEKCIADGEQLSRKSGEALNKIAAGVEKSTIQMGAIARATEEQSKGSQMIRASMERVSEMVGQIAGATKEQGKGSELIMASVERMKGLTAQVRSSAREQAKVGNFIARSTEDISAMVRHIKTACDEQTRGSGQIAEAVENILQSAGINVAATRVMDESVVSLSRQIGVLDDAMTNFKVKAQTEKSA